MTRIVSKLTHINLDDADPVATLKRERIAAIIHAAEEIGAGSPVVALEALVGAIITYSISVAPTLPHPDVAIGIAADLLTEAGEHVRKEWAQLHGGGRA